MDEKTKQMKKEREDNELAFYTGKMPSRVPLRVNFSMDVVAQYAGFELREALWDSGRIFDKADELCQKVFTDICLLGSKARMPAYYEALGSRNSVMSSSGFMQHPNTVALFPEEYDDFIANPVDTIVEKVIPRNYTRLDYTKNPAAVMFPFLEAEYTKGIDGGTYRSMSSRLVDKYGYMGNVPGTFGACYATMDLFVDNIRSLSEISKDIRRMPEKVKAAVDALYPFNYYCGKVAKVIPTSLVDYPLHLPPFISNKNFEKLWWPTWKRQCEDYASLGVHSGAFVEGDWTRYMDYLEELPPNARLRIEAGDPKLFKERLGKRHILMGMFPLDYITTHTREECVDKTKEWLDLMAPGGHYIFGFNKTILSVSDVNFDNLAAICATVRDYGVYDNAGQPSGSPVLEPTQYTHSEVPPVKSKYIMTWEQYKAANPYVPDIARERVEKMGLYTMKNIYNLLR